LSSDAGVTRTERGGKGKPDLEGFLVQAGRGAV